jgi:hypothetical protein
MSRCDRAARWLTPIISAGMLVVAYPAAAQAEEQAAARTLFDEGRRLVKTEDYLAACPKFEAAAKLYAGPGVLLNLGDCYEHTNRTASAWAAFAEAEASAARAGRTDEGTEARRRKALLEPRLAKIQIVVTAYVPGLAIERDHKPLDRAAWGATIPVDPGEHVVTATAPGRVSWSTSVRTDDPGKEIVVNVPSLRPAPTREPVAPGADVQWRGVGAQRVAGAVTAGAGVVAIGVGGVFALGAKAKWNQANAESGVARRDDSASAVRQGNVATGVVIGGAVLAVAGIVLWFAAPRARADASTGAFSFGGQF